MGSGRCSAVPCSSSAGRRHTYTSTPALNRLLLLLCACSTRRHLGHSNLYHPTYRGFDTYTGLPYSGDMGCLDLNPRGCGAGHHAGPSCPARCGADDQAAALGGDETAIPLYASSNDWDGTNCSSRNCSQEIILAPFNPNTLNEHYTRRAEDIFARYGAGGAKEGTPLFLYVAFAHTHTPMGYTDAMANTSTRPKPPARSSSVYGDTLAEVWVL